MELSLADLNAKLGSSYKSMDEITAALQGANKSTATADDKAVAKGNTYNDLVAAIKDIQGGAAQAKVLQEKELQASKEADLESQGFAKAFDRANSNEKLEMLAKAQAVYGNQALAVELAGGVQKALLGTFSKTDSRKDAITDFRSTNDLIHTCLAIKGGIESNTDDSIEVNGNVVRRVLDTLERKGVDISGFKKTAPPTQYDSQTLDEGAAWIPTYLSSDYIDNIWLNLSLAPLFDRIDMPSPTFDIPRVINRGKAYMMGEVTAATASTFFSSLGAGLTQTGFNTTKISLHARKMAALSLWSDEVSEDALLPMAQMIMADNALALAVSIDDAIMNGDRTGTDAIGGAATTNLDNTYDTTPLWWTSGTPNTVNTADSRYAWDGIRRNFQLHSGNSGIDGSTLNLTTLRSARKAMGKYGINPKELVWALSPSTYQDFLGLPEFASSLLSMSFGPNPTVLSGQLAQIDGIPILVHESVYTNLNSSGVYQTGAEGKTIAALFRPTGYKFGDRRVVRMEKDRNIFAGLNGLVTTWRGDFIKTRATDSYASIAGAQAKEEMIVRNLTS